MAIITAVRNPYEANKGIGANARMAKPIMDEMADATSATPVPSPGSSHRCLAAPEPLQLLPVPHGEVDAVADRHGADGGSHQVDGVAGQMHEGIEPRHHVDRHRAVNGAPWMIG